MYKKRGRNSKCSFLLLLIMLFLLALPAITAYNYPNNTVQYPAFYYEGKTGDWSNCDGIDFLPHKDYCYYMAGKCDLVMPLNSGEKLISFRGHYLTNQEICYIEHGLNISFWLIFLLKNFIWIVVSIAVIFSVFCFLLFLISRFKKDKKFNLKYAITGFSIYSIFTYLASLIFYFLISFANSNWFLCSFFLPYYKHFIIFSVIYSLFVFFIIKKLIINRFYSMFTYKKKDFQKFMKIVKKSLFNLSFHILALVAIGATIFLTFADINCAFILKYENIGKLLLPILTLISVIYPIVIFVFYLKKSNISKITKTSHIRWSAIILLFIYSLIIIILLLTLFLFLSIIAINCGYQMFLPFY